MPSELLTEGEIEAIEMSPSDDTAAEGIIVRLIADWRRMYKILVKIAGRPYWSVPRTTARKVLGMKVNDE